MTSLYDPLTAGDLELANRVVMAPLTRSRAGDGMVPTDLNVEYYRQRAGAGLIIAEGTQPSAVGQGYMDTPGLHTDEQAQGWRAVGEAVHRAGGRIVVQLMHVGRIAHPANKNGLETVSASAVAAPGQILTPAGMADHPTPRALEPDELAGVVAEFVDASRRAVAAGLDGVELHSANGYLLHQFLSPASNVRTDGYGGSPAARARFVVEVAQAVAAEIGAGRVGIRISPANGAGGTAETDAADVAATYGALVDGLRPLGLAYLHVLGDPHAELTHDLRARFGGTFMVNSGFAALTSQDEAEELVAGGHADLVSVGRMFIANPDLVTRWRHGADVNEPDPSTFYGGGPEGYTDYPALAS
ncbi:MAG TPA: alkene reductase [Actinomycetales bacterium]|jgi:2,4-dienoyl-CoA reductase-like NADH-dependent reductase (Old Yellow Enzyme family)